MKIKINDNIYNISNNSDDILSLNSPKYLNFENISYEEAKNIAELKEINWFVLEETVNENEEIIIKEYDCSNFCIIKKIIDNRNGIITIEVEELPMENAIPTDFTSKKLKNFIDDAKRISLTLSDENAILYINLYPDWKENKKYIPEERIQYKNNLYKVLIEHISTLEENPEANETNLYQKLS